MSQAKVGKQGAKPLTLGREIIELEAEALKQLASSLPEHFEKVVETIASLPEGSRLIVSGMGKAGFIAQKISATFASTGVPSFFLHPAEAAHGDLGRFSKKDIVLILSNSGETEEVLKMLPFVKRRGCLLIALTGNPDSQLAQHSDMVLSIGRCKEAGPLGLAPTTSTIMMLALGDALAMTVLDQQNFSPEEFAIYHPGGHLGWSLTEVSELMRSGDRHCVVSKDATIREVVKSYSEAPGRPGAATIVDEAGKVCGIFTDGDLRRLLASEESFLDLIVGEYLSGSPKSITADKLAEEAMNMLTENRIDQLVVVDDEGRPLGLLDIQDVMAAKTK